MRFPSAARPLLPAALGLLALAGCSASSGNVETTILERLRAQDYPEASKVTCDRKTGLKKGDKIHCDAQVGEASVPLEIEFIEDKTFSYKNTSNVVRKADLEGLIVSQSVEAFPDVKVDCGSQQIYVVRDIPKATCTATVDGTTTFPLALTVQDPNRVVTAIPQPYVALAKVEKDYAAKATQETGAPVTLDCPGGSIYLGKAGDTITCNVVVGTTPPKQVTITVLEEPGRFTLTGL